MNEKQLSGLLDAMTLDEKIYQLLQLHGSVFQGTSELTGPQSAMGLTSEMVRHTGSVFNCFGAENLAEKQRTHLANHRLGIPILFCADIVYGYKTILPVPLGYACSWNPERVRDCMAMVADEASASGIHGVFSPMADLVRDPRWGRVMESTGEDPLLNSHFAAAAVEGFQGNLDDHHVAACVKHFAAYGAAEGGREYNTVDMSERRLRQDYLPAYLAAVRAGSRMVMSAFNVVDGIPASGNQWLMRDVLRQEWGFEGVLVSDYAAVTEMIAHGYSEDPQEAAVHALKAGIDMDMMTTVYARWLHPLIRSGAVDISLLDEAVMRILTLKNDMGLFEDPFRGACAETEAERVGTPGNMKLAEQLAVESLVLLENKNHTLPLKPAQRVALIGPYGHERSLCGFWAITAETETVRTLREALAARCPDLIWYQGCQLLDDDSFCRHLPRFEAPGPCGDIQGALTAAAQADVIVAAVGEHMFQSGEAASRTRLRLSDGQMALLKALRTLGKPLVVVNFSGRPLVLREVAEHSDALIQAWFPGSGGAEALASVLYGDISPSGRLAMSFPRSEGQIPVYYNHFRTGRPLNPGQPDGKFVSRYIDEDNTPEYPFGYGLTYSDFTYSDLSAETSTFRSGDTMNVSVTVKNTGSCEAIETVQFYIQDKAASVVRPVRELKHYCRLCLRPGESRRVVYRITEQDLRFINKDMEMASEAGEFIVYAGGDSRCDLNIRFRLTD